MSHISRLLMSTAKNSNDLGNRNRLMLIENMQEASV